MDDQRPGEWFDISSSHYQRLVNLARRRLVGCEHHAEDVLSRAIERWLAISPDHPTARIETIITSEAYSLLRSEGRRRARERRVVEDRSSPIGKDSLVHHGEDLPLLRRMLADSCRHHGIAITAVDLEVLELLCAGYTIAETARSMELPRHVVKRSRARWQLAAARVYAIG